MPRFPTLDRSQVRLPVLFCRTHYERCRSVYLTARWRIVLAMQMRLHAENIARTGLNRLCAKPSFTRWSNNGIFRFAQPWPVGFSRRGVETADGPQAIQLRGLRRRDAPKGPLPRTTSVLRRSVVACGDHQPWREGGAAAIRPQHQTSFRWGATTASTPEASALPEPHPTDLRYCAMIFVPRLAACFWRRCHSPPISRTCTAVLDRHDLRVFVMRPGHA